MGNSGVRPPPRATLQLACETLVERDPALARAYAEIGVPDWRVRPATYETLARMVCYQQISTIAGGAIWARLAAEFDPVKAESLLAASDDTLKACGLSRPKVAHLRSIATAVIDGRLNLDALIDMHPHAARKSLIAVKGIGPWTADLFLLYAAKNLDAFPVADIGLMESHKLLSNAATRMDAKTFTAYAERWRPYRGVAAHLLWGALNARRERMAKDSPTD